MRGEEIGQFSDEELFRRIREEQDEKAFRALLRRYYAPTVTLAARLLGEGERASQQAEAALLAAIRCALAGGEPIGFAQALRCAVVQSCEQALGESSAPPGPDEPIPSSATVEEADQLLAKYLPQLIRTLPPRQQIAYRLREQEGWSVQEIARCLRAEVPEIARLLAQARLTLHARLQPLLERCSRTWRF